LKHIIYIIFTVLISSVGFTQTPDTFTYDHLADLGFQVSNTVLNFPTEKPERVVVATKSSGASYHVLLLLSVNDSACSKISSLEIEDEMDFKCSDPHATYENGYLNLECLWMNGTMFVTKLTLINNQLSFVENYQYDINEAVYSKAETAKKENDPVAFCEAYSGAQYYSDLEQRTKESLEWAHKNALQFFKNKDYKSAASLMLDMEHRCSLATEIYDFMGKSFVSIWGDATLFYLKAGLNEECVRLSERLIKIDNKLTGVHLQYGDALYNLQRFDESKPVYNKYMILMHEDNKKDKIPSRVIERVK